METERFLYWSRIFCAILKQCRAGFPFVFYEMREKKKREKENIKAPNINPFLRGFTTP
jgi:hypothetical protein